MWILLLGEIIIFLMLMFYFLFIFFILLDIFFVFVFKFWKIIVNVFLLIGIVWMRFCEFYLKMKFFRVGKKVLFYKIILVFIFVFKRVVKMINLLENI